MIKKSSVRLKPYARLTMKWLLGPKLTESIFEFIYLRRIRQAPVIFIHIPKAAGTSIAEVVYGRRAGHLTAARIRELLGPEVFQEQAVFSVVRNPYTRLYSAYCFARYGGSGGGVEPDPVYNSELFETFERFVHEWLYFQELSTLDFIFRPQVDFILGSDGEWLVDHIGHVEELETTETWLSVQLGEQVTFQHDNVSRAGGENGDLILSDKTRSIIHELYRRDFELLGY